MLISDILLIGVKNPRLETALKAHGYGTITIGSPDRCEDVEQECSVIILDQSFLGCWNSANTEKLYFLTGMTPVVVLLHRMDNIPPSLEQLLEEGTYDYMYEHEIETGLAIKRIERTYLSSRSDILLRHMQRDLQERTRLEEELSMRANILKREQEISASILSSIRHGLLLIDESGTIVVANPKARDMIGQNSRELLGLSYTSLPPEIRSIIDSFIMQLSADHTSQPVHQCTLEGRTLSFSAYTLLYCPHASGTLLLVNDITEQEAMNMQLYRAEKLATVGTMLSGIAHELRNPLTIISGRAQRALSKLSPDMQQWISSSFDSIDQQVRRCASIVNNVLDFTRVTADNQGVHNASELLDEALAYVSYQPYGPTLDISKMYNRRLTIHGDRSRLTQLFLNIISNAAQAMNGEGRLTITCDSVENNLGLITVADTGPGISQENLNKVFDPFFTTKDPGQGTGLGLSIAYKIAQQSGGTIWFTSQPGDTKFFIQLPSSEECTNELQDSSGR